MHGNSAQSYSLIGQSVFVSVSLNSFLISNSESPVCSFPSNICAIWQKVHKGIVPADEIVVCRERAKQGIATPRQCEDKLNDQVWESNDRRRIHTNAV